MLDLRLGVILGGTICPDVEGERGCEYVGGEEGWEDDGRIDGWT